MDSSAHTTPVNFETVNKNRVATDSEIITETTSRTVAWICQHSRPLSTQKQSRKSESLLTCKLSPKLQSTSDTWIHQRTQPLLSLK